MKTRKIHIKSADISEERLKQLVAAPFEKRAIPIKERVKKAIGFFLCGVLLLIGAIVFIALDLPYGLSTTFIALACPLGGIVLIIISIIELCTKFQDFRKKSAENAISSFFIILFGEDIDFDKKVVSLSYDAFMRMLPEMNVVDNEKFIDYLVNFRKTIRQTLDNDYQEVIKTSNSQEKYLNQLSFNPINVKNETHEIYKVNQTCELNFYVNHTEQNSNEIERLYYTRYDITLDLLLIKSGECWVLADPMPDYTLDYALPNDKQNSI
jgi:hypothetical protein